MMMMTMMIEKNGHDDGNDQDDFITKTRWNVQVKILKNDSRCVFTRYRHFAYESLRFQTIFVSPATEVILFGMYDAVLRPAAIRFTFQPLWEWNWGPIDPHVATLLSRIMQSNPRFRYFWFFKYWKKSKVNQRYLTIKSRKSFVKTYPLWAVTCHQVKNQIWFLFAL